MMRGLLLACLCSAALSCAGCGGILVGTEFSDQVRPDGARPVPQSYYLPMGEVPITLEWDATKQRFDYPAEYASVSVPDRDFGRLALWHSHRGLSHEQLSITVDPKTMLLQKASSTYEPRTNEALVATAALLRQTTELRTALSGPLEGQRINPPADNASKSESKCQGVKVAGRIRITPHKLQKVSLTNIVAIKGCEIIVHARVEPVDPKELPRDGVSERIVDKQTIAETCAEAICFRLPRRYTITLMVDVQDNTIDDQLGTLQRAPQIEPFEVSSPDRTQVAYVRFPAGTFATKETQLEFTDGMLATYNVNNESPVVGTLTVATSALLVATAAAEMH